MIQVKCIQKFRNKMNKIYGYRLVDINGQTQDVTPSDLKRAITQEQINVVNIKLTSDGRLVDKTPDRQLVNKRIMPNKVEKPYNTNDKLLDIMKACANKIANAINGNDAKYIDGDLSDRGRVIAQFDIGKSIVYRGAERQLDMLIDIQSTDKEMYIGLIDMDKLDTEADKSIKCKSFNINVAMKLTEKYIEYIKSLNNTKYKAIAEDLMWIDELDDDIDELSQKYSSNVKVIEIPNNIDVDNFLSVDDSASDMLYPYMYTDGEAYALSDYRENFIVAFIDKDICTKTLYYSNDRSKCNEILNKLHIKTDTTRCEECDYSEKVIGLSSKDYIGQCSINTAADEFCTRIDKLPSITLLKVNVEKM